MAGVVPSVASTKQTTNYSRLCRLLVDICSQALRDKFDGIHAPANLHTVLASHPVHSTLQALFKGKKKILNPAQWCKLYPAVSSSVSSATFDITLLMVLLRNICGLRPPATGWGSRPSEEDKSLEADIVRIKHFRNTVYALAAQASVNDATFNTHWQNIREVLVRLGGAKYEDAVDILKTECMDPDIEEHYKELLQQWKKDEYVIKEQLHEMGEDIKYIKEALRVALNKHGEKEVHLEMMHPDKIPDHRGELLEMHLSTSGQETNEINTKEKYGDSSLYEVNQHCQSYRDARYRTEPPTGPSSVNTEGKQHHRVPHAGRPLCPDDTKDRMDPTMTTTSGNTGMRYHPRINSQQSGQVTDQDVYGVSPERSQSYGVTHQSFDARNSTVPPGWSSHASNKLNYDTRYSTVPESGSRFEVDQYNQDPRYRTFPQTGPSAVNTEGSQTYHRVPHAGRPLCPDDTKDRMDPAMTTSHSVSHHETVTPLHPTSQYSSERCAGSDTRGYAVVAKRTTVVPSNEVISDANGYHSKDSPRTKTGMHGSASGDARYANVRDTSIHGGPKFGSDESCRLMSAKDSAKPCDVREVKYGQTSGTSPPEPMEVGQTEYSRDGQNDATSFYNGITGVYATPAAQSGVKKLNSTLRRQLGLDPSVGLADKDSKQISKVPIEHRRQYGSETMPSTKEVTASGGRTRGQAQPPRFLFQTGSSSAYDKDTGENTRISAADTTSHTTEKREARGSSPLPSRRTSVQREMNPPLGAQTPGHSSRINRLPSTKPAVSQGLNAPNMDGKVELCEFCMVPGTSICQNCFNVVCRKCKEYYNADLCEKTKGEHKFKDLKKSIQTQHRKSELFSQNFKHVNQSIRNDGQDWPCSRCTFLNPPDHTVCSMCATTRGVGPVELTQAGSRVCRNCTFHNEENAKVCSACHKTLDLHPPETFTLLV